VNVLGPKKIVLLGMMTKIPVAGAIWGTVQYLLGLQRLGYEVYYVEAHARTPSMLMRHADDDSSALAARFIERVLRRFDLQHRWAFHALHADGRCYGMTSGQLKELYRTAALIINYHGGTVPLPEHYATGRLVYLETDPVQREIEVHEGNARAIAILEPHCAFFSWGLNYGQADCRVPLPERFPFKPTLPVVVPDLWQSELPRESEGTSFTTVGNWRQAGEVRYEGEVYTWSKHSEYLKFIDLPARTPQSFELALGSCSEDERHMLKDRGWKVRDALDFSLVTPSSPAGADSPLDAYRAYVTGSRGEFTVAKDQNIRLRSGWFSERSAQYLAAGRPVITQETGFSNVLPTGAGLFAFSSMEEILEAVEAINADYQRHCRAAAALAREYFHSDVVLKKLLAEVGVG
jgi:hypothetical protein